MTTTDPLENVEALPLTGDRYEVSMGPNTQAIISAGQTAAGHVTFILTPPAGTAHIGCAYELTTDDVVKLGAAIYATLPDAGQLRFVAALGQNREK